MADGRIDYHGSNNFMASVPPRFETMVIADIPNTEIFKAELLAHQLGQTDFQTFIKMCATVGIKKWVVSMDKKTCTYYDKRGNELLKETIPQN